MMFLFSGLWRRLLLPLSILTILSACATPKPTAPDIDGLFQRSGRFSVTVNDFSGVKDAVQGGFVWQDDGSSLVLDLANPLGSTLARITVEDGMAVLTHSNGSQEYARDADGLADGEVLDVRAEGGDVADDFVAGDEGVLGDFPLVVEHGEVRVADAAGGDVDLDVVGGERAGLIFEGFELAVRGAGGECADGGHGRNS